MRFCFVIFKYFPFGGLQRSMRNIAVACVEAGHGVTVYTTQWTGEKIPGIHIVELVGNKKKTRERDLQFAKAFLKTVDTSCFDLVVGFNKIPGLDIYYSGDTCFAVKAHEKQSWLYRMTKRCRVNLKFESEVFARGLYTKILMVAREQKTDYQKYFQTETERFYFIPPGIARDRIAPSNRSDYGIKLRKNLDIKASWQIVTMVASNLRLKGYHRALKAFLSLPDHVRSKTILILVGADSRIDEYRKQVYGIGLQHHVKFLGGRDDVPEILFGSDLLIHPAHREATGNVLLEGAVAGVPVLCSGVCGYSFYIDQHNLGRVVQEPFCQHNLNTMLHEMLTNHKQREIWGRNCRDFSSNDEIFSRFSRVLQIFEEVASAKINPSLPLFV